MASRSGAGVGVWVTISILTVLTITLFVLTLVFFGQRNQFRQDVATLESRFAEFIAQQDMGAARVTALLSEARAQRVTLTEYLIAERRALAALAAGSEELSAEQARERAEARAELSGGSLLETAEQLQRRLAAAERERDEQRARAQAAVEDLNREIERLASYEQGIAGAVASANQRVEGFASDVERNRQQLAQLEARLQREREEERGEFQAEIRELEGEIARLNADNLQLAELVRDLRAEAGAAIAQGLDEFALVDGRVIGVDPINNEAVISLGRSERLSIGLTFNVYGSPSELRPDPATGEYTDGKAVLEVVEIGGVSSRTRIIREGRGNPVVSGDVIANPLYDPDKVYRFVVFGEFDTNRDGVATAGERRRLEALIRDWGGVVTDDVQGDLDFVVLGRRPVVPPPPDFNAPLAVVEEWTRLQRRAERFDELFERASSAAIPVLNFNRLMTLIGEVPN